MPKFSEKTPSLIFEVVCIQRGAVIGMSVNWHAKSVLTKCSARRFYQKKYVSNGSNEVAAIVLIAVFTIYIFSCLETDWNWSIRKIACNLELRILK